ncbi:MAG: PD-(D/E)XK nuclease family protein [Firmicutes bacterium]|nr:PD-(D/E)XK nuclease family protein [Bacillota bacterium]
MNCVSRHGAFERMVLGIDVGNGLSPNNIIIVPDKVTLEVEREVINILKAGRKIRGEGVFNVEVLTFARLFARYFKSEKKPLSRANAVLILKRLVLENRERLVYFKKGITRVSFAKNMVDIIKQLQSSNVLPDDLDKLALKGTGLIEYKVKDIAFLYRLYMSAIKEYVDSAGLLNLLARGIKENHHIKNSNVYVAYFDVFTPLQAVVVGELNKYAKSLTLMDNSVSQHLHKASVSPSATPSISPNATYATTLANTLSGIYEAVSISDELENLAQEIRYLVVNKGARYKDIKVIAPLSYMARIQRVMRNFDIPVHTDQKVSLEDSPLADYMLKALSAVKSGFRRRECLAFAKHKLFLLYNGLTECDVSFFENYILKYNITFLKKGAEIFDSFYADSFLKVREALFSTLEALGGLKGLSASKFSETLKGFLASAPTQQFLELISSGGGGSNGTLETQGSNGGNQQGFESDLVLESVVSQSVSKLSEILDSFALLLGRTIYNLDDFYLLLHSSIVAAEISVLPKSLECVQVICCASIYVGSFAKGASNILFVVGANENLLMPAFSPNGIIDEPDIAALKVMGVDITPTPRDAYTRLSQNIYSNVLRADALYFSYLSLNASGSSKKIDLLEDIILATEFPILNLAIKDELANTCESTRLKIFSSKNYAYNKMLQEILKKRLFTKRDINAQKEVYQIFSANKHKALAIEKVRNFVSEPKRVPNTKFKLGQSGRASISRVESFYNCPYKHFLDYGLALKEREMGGLRAVDVGSFLHSVIEQFVLEVVMNSQNLTPSALKNVVASIVEKVRQKDEFAVLLNSETLTSALKRLEDEAQRVCAFIYYADKHSLFKPVGAEINFELEFSEGGQTFKFSGVIDRVDVYDDGDKRYVRIIDYKTGRVKFSLKNVYFGKALQLFTYYNAYVKAQGGAGEVGGGGEVSGGGIIESGGSSADSAKGAREFKNAGVYYFPVANEFLAKSDLDAGENLDIERGVYRLVGVTLDNIDVIKAHDTLLESGEKSRFIDVALTKKGVVHGGYTGHWNKVLASDVLDNISDYTDSMIRAALQKMAEGYIDIIPLKDACKLCGFANICGIDLQADRVRCDKLKVCKDAFEIF